MKIREMIREIEEAVDVMVDSEERGESFHNLKKNVVEKIHETEAAADAMLGNEDVHIGDELREKIKEVGGRIKELVKEIKDASDVMLIDDRK